VPEDQHPLPGTDCSTSKLFICASVCSAEGGDGTAVAVPEDQLPLTLPETDNFKPSGTPESPLAVIDSWVNTTDPETGGPPGLPARNLGWGLRAFWNWWLFVGLAADATLHTFIRTET
jgi:hypothetical protein